MEAFILLALELRAAQSSGTLWLCHQLWESNKIFSAPLPKAPWQFRPTSGKKGLRAEVIGAEGELAGSVHRQLCPGAGRGIFRESGAAVWDLVGCPGPPHRAQTGSPAPSPQPLTASHRIRPALRCPRRGDALSVGCLTPSAGSPFHAHAPSRGVERLVAHAILLQKPEQPNKHQP